MSRVFLVVFIIYLLLPDDTLCAHRTSATRQKSVIAAAAKSKTSSMRTRMKHVLHLRDDNSLTSMFDMDDEDPAYVFVLPDKRNKTIVFHQRDFTEMEYPMISEVGRNDGPVFYKPVNATVLRDAKTNKTVPAAQRLIVRDEDEDYPSSLEDYSDEEEAEMNRIIEENVRTERNFIRHMEDLNHKPREQKQVPLTASPTKTSDGMRFKHFGDYYHPDLFHNPAELSPLEEEIRPPPPTTGYEVEEEDDEEEEEEVVVKRPRNKNRSRKVKKKSGYGNIGEVISPPYSEDSVDQSDEFVREHRIVPKLKSASKRPKHPPPPPFPGDTQKTFTKQRVAAVENPSNVYESRKQESSNGGWDEFGLEGWSGGLSEAVLEFEGKVERPPPSDIFNEGITYNRMKEMFHKEVQYSYHQIHPSPSVESGESTGESEPVNYHHSRPSPYGSKPTSWRETNPSLYTNRPRPGLKSPYAEEPSDEIRDGDYGHNPYQGQEYAQVEDAVPSAPAATTASEEYVPPRVRPKYKNRPHPFDEERQRERYPAEEEQEEQEEEDDLNNETEDSDYDAEEYVYMINGKPISLELAQLLQNEHTPLNLTRHVKVTLPKWPITSSRSSHRDADVFVARANNPFGHSTKWKWSNASASYVIPKKNKKRGGRSKRAIPQLYSMVKCATGCDPIVYKGYGCYCGFLGMGEPLDGIDKCCKMHDNCYTHTGCPQYLEYFVPYLWKCYKGTPLCAVSHGEWGDANSCAARLCQCDLKLSMCLRRYYCPLKRNVCTASPWRLLQNFIMDF